MTGADLHLMPDGQVCVLPGQRFSVFRSNVLPPDVSFGFYVSDNSLRPHFKKGELVYCDDQQLHPGDIGLFNWKGETVCRQYLKDSCGFTYLFTLDRKRDREDIILPVAQEAQLTCYGRVQTKKRIPLPGL